MLRKRLGSPRASHGGGFCASFPWARLLLRRAWVPFVVRLEEVEHQPQREEIASHVELLRAAGIDLRARQRPAILDDQRHRPAQLYAKSHTDIPRGGVGLVVHARAA